MAVPAPPLLSLEHVTVLRGAREQRPALDDVTLRIGAGEHVCILGPNGCGKSTLIKTITRECYPLAREGSGRGAFGIFQQHENLSASPSRPRASCASNRDPCATGNCTSRGARGRGDVF